MAELKEITIQFIKEKPNIEIVDHDTHKLRSVAGSVIGDGELLLKFANLYQDQPLLEHLSELLVSSVQDELESYLTEKHEQLKPILGELMADIIMFDYINPIVRRSYKGKRPSVMNYAKRIVCGLNKLCMMADSDTALACRASSSEHSYFLFAMLFEQTGGFNGEVHYGVHPLYVDGKLVIYDVFTIKSSHSALMFDLACVAKGNVKIKTCKNCGKYFIPSSRSDEIYCDNIFKNGKTCKQLGYEIKVSNDEILRTYRKVYKTQNARKQRNADNIAAIEERFDAWTEKAKVELGKCQEGLITVSQFEDLISSDDWMMKKPEEPR